MVLPFYIKMVSDIYSFRERAKCICIHTIAHQISLYSKKYVIHTLNIIMNRSISLYDWYSINIFFLNYYTNQVLII